MEKFSNYKSLTLAKGVYIAYQVSMTSMVTFGIIRLIIGLVSGEIDANLSFGAYQ
jgi:hypothetical protein